MKTSFDTDTILYRILRDSPVKSTIDGDVYYTGDRPNDSEKEDIEINSVTLTQDYLPQLGRSNVNIYVPDIMVRINGKDQKTVNRIRLKSLAEMAITSIREANIEGLKAIVTNQRVIPEPNINQHFVNIAINWNIQIE